MDIHKVIGKIPFKSKKGFVLPKFRFTGPHNPIPGNEPYNAVNAIFIYHIISVIEITIRQMKNVDVTVKC